MVANSAQGVRSNIEEDLEDGSGPDPEGEFKAAEGSRYMKECSFIESGKLKYRREKDKRRSLERH